MTEQSAIERICDLTRWRDWVVNQGDPLFTSISSAEWFLRKHRKELVESGQLILRSGPGGSLVGLGFGAVVLEILRRESHEAVTK